jgi:hypothetical protein
MKTIKIAILGLILLVANSTQAQVSVNVNIGAAPDWGPAGYRNAEYYYLPDIQSYYDVRASQFIYLAGHNWVRSNRLPRHHSNYNLYNGYKVVLTDYHGRTPYVYHDKHRARYHHGYHKAPQHVYKVKKEHKHYTHNKPGNHHKKEHHKNDHRGRR